MPDTYMIFDSKGFGSPEEMKEQITSRFWAFFDHALTLPIVRAKGIDHFNVDRIGPDSSRFLTRRFPLIPEDDQHRYFKLTEEYSPYMFQEEEGGNR